MWFLKIIKCHSKFRIHFTPKLFFNCDFYMKMHLNTFMHKYMCMHGYWMRPCLSLSTLNGLKFHCVQLNLTWLLCGIPYRASTRSAALFRITSYITEKIKCATLAFRVNFNVKFTLFTRLIYLKTDNLIDKMVKIISRHFLKAILNIICIIL